MLISDAGQGWLFLAIGGKDFCLRRAGELEFRRILHASARAPFLVAKVDDLELWIFQEQYFFADRELTPTEVHRAIAWGLPSA